MRRFLSVLLLMFSAAAMSADGNVSWVNATLNTDGTTIPASGPGALASTEIQWGLCTAISPLTFPAAPAGTLSVPFPGTTVIVPGLAPGDWCFRARHVTTDGIFSAWSGLKLKNVPVPKPKAPTSLNVL